MAESTTPAGGTPDSDDLLGNFDIDDADAGDAPPATPPASNDTNPPKDGTEPPAAHVADDEVPAAGSETPAEAVAEPPVATSPAAGDASTTTTPAAGTTTPPTPAAAAPAVAPAADPDAEFWRKHEEITARLSRGEVETVDLKPDELAVIAGGTAKLRAEMMARETVRTAETEYDRGWTTWQTANADVPGGRRIWEEELAKAKADPENATPAEAVGAARAHFKQRIAIVKGQSRAAAPAGTTMTQQPRKPAPAAARATAAGSTSVTPQGGGVRPPPRTLTPEEELVRDIGGDLRSLDV